MGKTIHIDSLQIGMVLAEPVKNKFNQVLCSGNLTIEDKHIKLFKTWGIQSISVTETETANSNSEAVLNEDFSGLKKFFSWEPRNEAEIDLFKMAQKRYNDLNIWDAKK